MPILSHAQMPALLTPALGLAMSSLHTRATQHGLLPGSNLSGQAAAYTMPGYSSRPAAEAQLWGLLSKLASVISRGLSA